MECQLENRTNPSNVALAMSHLKAVRNAI